MLLLRVAAVGPGAGTNGGRYASKASGPGETTEFLASSAVHRPIHPVTLSRDFRLPGNVSPLPASPPFGFDHEGLRLGSSSAGILRARGECRSAL
jgi:hypothetical protein